MLLSSKLYKFSKLVNGAKSDIWFPPKSIYSNLIKFLNGEISDISLPNIVNSVKLVKWEINYKKSVLHPVNKITFLGATWSPLKVTRAKGATKALSFIWSQIKHLKSPLSGKPLERIRGFFKLLFGIRRELFVGC